MSDDYTRLAQLRRMAAESPFAGERDNARRLADRLEAKLGQTVNRGGVGGTGRVTYTTTVHSVPFTPRTPPRATPPPPPPRRGSVSAEPTTAASEPQGIPPDIYAAEKAQERRKRRRPLFDLFDPFSGPGFEQSIGPDTWRKQ